MRKRSRWLSRSVLGLMCLAFAGAAGAASFGPLAVLAPSAIVPEAGPSEALSGAIALDVSSVPVASPTLFSLTSVSVLASSGASFALDPDVPSPALGVVQAAGNFLIPTLFLHIVDGESSFDLAVPDVTGTLFFGFDGSVVGIVSSFSVDSLSPDGTLTVNLLALVPEPSAGALALATLMALGALGARARTEVSR